VTLETFWLYLGAVVLIACTPGPNVLYVTTRSVRFGLGGAYIGMAGCLIALVLMLIGSVAGLSAFMLAVPAAFDLLKYAGAAYLIWLGIQTWRAPVDAPQPSAAAEASRPLSLFGGGFLVGISNPKLLVFAAAFFPQFIDPGAAWAPQFGLMVATFVAVEFFFYCLYAAGGRRFAQHLLFGSGRRWFNRVSGVVFAGFGLALLRYRP
jgi:threonine/homoserine/homoserine lactone efflux protein